ncbi:dystrophin-like isoform X3 [Elysia marginata]|uniref:Dystrophin-like isoform X3 n=1 Tax=Elysia marginata TaxID=1093978 RepID=A0AAV4GEV7_9GAST|nr:dystrophin-like isoform X3 [Elysia marginata]
MTTPSSSQSSLPTGPSSRYRLAPQLVSTPQTNGHHTIPHDDPDLSGITAEINSPPHYSAVKARAGGSSNVGDLFHIAGEVGQAVGSLVTVMTDEDAAAAGASGNGEHASRTEGGGIKHSEQL